MKTSKKLIYSLILAVITLAFLFFLEANKAKYGMAYTVLTKVLF